jgi:hypothetical protein
MKISNIVHIRNLLSAKNVFHRNFNTSTCMLENDRIANIKISKSINGIPFYLVRSSSYNQETKDDCSLEEKTSTIFTTQAYSNENLIDAVKRTLKEELLIENIVDKAIILQATNNELNSNRNVYDALINIDNTDSILRNGVLNIDRFSIKKNNNNVTTEYKWDESCEQNFIDNKHQNHNKFMWGIVVGLWMASL